ncbi:type IIL restriction-modification enzyme MmeI, partial [Klebsiella pneumoniae]|uniref:type IIL restriction-modification enzyme MmeI n=1 Tax=Klebsiella pneumoniae TaxID=573 RepID=UPI0033130940
PHLFRPNSARPKVPYLCIPAHVSENRKFFLSQRFEPEVICGNANFQTSDEDGFQFGLISSSMFITWQRTVGGRLESRLRFANTLTW